MTDSPRDEKDGPLRLGAEFWVYALVVAPVIIDLVLGLVLFLTDDEFGTFTSAAKIAVVVAWPILSVAAAVAITKLDWLQTRAGSAIRRIRVLAFLSVAAMVLVWSPFVGVLLAVFLESDSGGGFD